MKKIFYFFFIINLIININTSYANDKIVFIDLDLVLKKTLLGSSILSNLENLNNQNIEELKKKESELKKADEEIKSKQNIISKEEFDKEINILREKLSNYRKIKDQMVANLDKKKRDELNNFFNKINPIIQKHMENNSIDILLERKNVFIGNSNSDITEIIIVEVDKNFKK